ncbi:hypothetical protein [Bradyrhizobium sp. F1.13.3]|uniref:hypothetical protein n=1 Tax=Bradyrhizobium sp. F1.13.3 TaxID=3156351 RepID=UPI00339871BB
MSRHLRFYFAGLVLVGGLPTPACSDSFTALFNIAPREPAATSSAQAECLPRPGSSPAAGQHWVYRRDGHRKCWFLAEGIAGRVANRGARSVENETEQQRANPVIDARAESPSSSPAEGAQPRPAREVKVADANSVFDAGTPALMAAAPAADLPTSQLTPEHRGPPQVDVEKLAAAARAVSPPAMPLGARNEEVRDEPRSWTVTWLGVLLMTLGGFSMLSSSRTLRQTVRLSQ